jgi:UDP-N-acetylglucosamine--N-acetylmuramyl-(pentapeptide) pyrophosphoryl-undecaprenol N-acetylglucosamine transferase
MTAERSASSTAPLRPSERVNVVIAGGGTAGHVMPAIGVADAFVAAGLERTTIVFAGARGGQEERLAPAAGYATELLRVTNFPRPLRPMPVTRSGARQVRGLLAAMRTIRRWRPAVVLSVGGFASAPWVLAAAIQAVPIVVLSYDAKPGAAHRAQARLAKASAVAFASSPLPKARHTGVPVRSSIEQLGQMDDAERTAARSAARIELGLPVERVTILVVGGSLGSGRLNATTSTYAAAHQSSGELTVMHVTGRRQSVDAVSDGRDGTICHHVVAFEDRMPLAYAAADVVVCRAGAMTVFEVAAAALPAIYVPWPLAAQDHQSANAHAVVDLGGGVLVADEDFTPERMTDELAPLLASAQARLAMGRVARTMTRPDAADAIAALCREVARRDVSGAGR